MLEYRKTAAAFGEFLDANVYKVGYLIGTRGERATQAQIDARLNSESYRSYWPKIPYAKKWLTGGVNDGAWVWADCMGWLEMFWNGGYYNRPLTKSQMQYPDVRTHGVYQLALDERLPNGDIASLPKDCPYPLAVGYSGHVGFYYKGLVYQSAGHSPGTIKSTLGNTDHNKPWQYWYMIPYLDYQGWMPGKDTDMLKRGDKGSTVGAWQRSLLGWNAGALPNYKDDNSFGPETEVWTNKFKASMNMLQDGIVDSETWGVMQDYLRTVCAPDGIPEDEYNKLKEAYDLALADIAGHKNVIDDLQKDIDALVASYEAIKAFRDKYGSNL